MRVDFHFHAIFLAARRSGFPRRHAYITAYASQHVDDCTDAKPRVIEGRLWLPERTARNPVSQALGAVSIQGQADFQIYHHMPREFALELVAAALRGSGAFSLIRLGIALHTLADTYAHEGFSGRWEAGNVCEALWVNGQEESPLAILPAISHTQLGYVPDRPWANWEAVMRGGRMLGRDNREAFEQALADITALLGGKLSERDWAKVRELFRLEEADDEPRCEAWRAAFNTPEYDAGAWEKAAMSKAEDRFLSSPWALFHRAARMQRCLTCGTYGLL